MRKWLNVELCKGSEEELFRYFLMGREIKYETSGAHNMVHFECFMSDEDASEASEVLDFIDALEDAKSSAGFRETYAMKYGSPQIKHDNNRLLVRFVYPKSFKYQDANGATFDVTDRRWVG